MGFQKAQCYGSEAHPQAYAAHEDIWSSKNNHHNPMMQGMHMKHSGPFVGSHEFSKHHDNPHMQMQAMHMKNNGPFVDSHDFPKHHGMFGGSLGNGMPREGPYGGHNSFGHGHHSPSGHHGYPSGGPSYPHHGGSGFSSGSKFRGHGPGYGHGHFSEETEYEAHKEMHNGAGKVKMDEVRYERHNYGGGDGFYANPHNRNMSNKTYVEWGLKGV